MRRDQEAHHERQRQQQQQQERRLSLPRPSGTYQIAHQQQLSGVQFEVALVERVGQDRQQLLQDTKEVPATNASNLNG